VKSLFYTDENHREKYQSDCRNMLQMLVTQTCRDYKVKSVQFR